ncbi:unnamed protein product [Tuber aestivum]|uniref:Uncharacterized protein n=1 Tax=Tuber aestivum TaxID=59557 RepID=A0A292Q0D0_9PEZI|nr:unnamed protein product [Tuber aestivum]
MPTALHETAAIWMRSEFVLWACYGLLTPATATAIKDGLITHDHFVGTFSGSSKTPDLAYSPCINGTRRAFPTVVLESGWTESQAQSLRDLELWQQGTAGAVKIVILFKLARSRVHNRLKATLSVSQYVAGGAPVMSVYPIFPSPSEPHPDPWITVDELFGGMVPGGLNPGTRLPLSLERLRVRVEAEMRQQGFVPAVTSN